MPKNDASMDLSLANRIISRVLSNERIPILLILILGGFLRFYHMDGYGLWSDEFVTLMIVSKDSMLDVIQTCFKIPQPIPPLYFLVDKLFVDGLGSSEISLRLLSAVSSVLTIYFVFSIGKTLFNLEIGIFSAILCAINSTQIVYAQNARPYAFCLLLSSASILAFLKWVQRETVLNKVAYLLSTTLLFYSHYVFFPLLIIQNLYFLWLLRTRQLGRTLSSTSRPWKPWLTLQLYVALLLTPLFPQIYRMIHARQSLNWASELPTFKDFFCFINAHHVWSSAGITLLLLGLGLYFKGIFSRSGEAKTASAAATLHFHPLVFLMLWYLVPLSFFFLLAKIKGINLFVERYLLLSSLAIYLLLTAVSICLINKKVARTFMIVYVLHYAAVEPWAHFSKKGHFSHGVPGGNEWRETLLQLKNPTFSGRLVLFQSPFIESNLLNFDSNPKLLDYLSAPLHSFYVRDLNPGFVLLPVHWWTTSDLHRKFKEEIKNLLLSHREFVLLSTQEFWDNFYPWLDRVLSDQYEIRPTESFQSSGSLRLKKITLSPKLKARDSVESYTPEPHPSSTL